MQSPWFRSLRAAAVLTALTAGATTASADPASRPAASQPLSVAYCPMAKAGWLQVGDKVANPYLGQEMPTCGTVKRTLVIPPSEKRLSPVIEKYLDVEKALSKDKIDSSGFTALKSATEELSDERYIALRESAAKLAGAKDLASVRAAFGTYSKTLTGLLDAPAEK